MKRRRKVRKINPQKIFCFISFMFIFTCCLWYGGRLVYFYRDSKKVETTEDKSEGFAGALIKANQGKKNFKKYDGEYYFYKDVLNNYLMYSNIMFRIVKINQDQSILLVTDNPITSLAYGTDGSSYSDSSIIKWLNKDDGTDNSGVLEDKLIDEANYFVKSSVCTDIINDATKYTCDKINKDYYLGLLSIDDFVKTGGKNSFINHGGSSYLANLNDEDEIWYVDGNGVLDKSSGEDILGIRATATLSSDISIKSGTGSKTDPYKISDKKEIFGSYVKLDTDLWRVYDISGDNVKLILMDYVNDANGKFESSYSNNTYRHNDTVYGSLAYYLNHTYLNSLSYKNLILDGYYYNGYYGEDNDYDVDGLYEGIIDTKVALPSIGDIILNDEASGYFTSTGTAKNGTSVYVSQGNGEFSSKRISTSSFVVPCITIKSDNLKLGSGTKNDPYRME